MARSTRTSAGADAGRTQELSSTRAIIDAGIFLFSRDGYSETGVQQIVDRAGLTKGSFYHSFASKDDLLCRIQDEFIDSCRAALDEALAEDLSPEVGLGKAIEKFVELAGTSRDALTIFFQESRYLREELFVDVRRKRDEFEQLFVTLLDRGEQSGAFRDVPARVVAFGIIGMCAWTYHWLRTESGSTLDVSRAYTDVLLNGLATGPPLLPPRGEPTTTSDAAA